MNLEKLCTEVCKVAKETGDFLRNERANFSTSSVEVKGLNNFVSYVDKEAEKQIVEKLRKLLPEAGFIAEEGTAENNNEKYRWVIDPLDGTTNFIHGLYPFAASIALMENEEVVIGVVYEVGLDECFYAWKDSKAYCNSKEIQVSDVKSLKDSLVATGFPYTNFDKLQRYFNSMEFILRNSHGARRLGSAATDLAYVACGRCEAFYEYALSPWDVAAGVLIVERAGGKVSDFSSGKNYIFGRELVASNANTFKEFQEFAARYFLD